MRDAVHEDRMKRKMNKSQTKRASNPAAAPSGQPQAQGSSKTQSQSYSKEPADTGYTQVQAGGFSKGSTHTASNIISGKLCCAVFYCAMCVHHHHNYIWCVCVRLCVSMSVHNMCMHAHDCAYKFNLIMTVLFGT